MAYYVKAGIGLLLMVAGYVVFAVALVKLIHIGTCASGGPYQIARPCPEGTGKWAAAIFISIPLCLIGAGLFAFRGSRPGQERRVSAFSFGTMAFGLFFLATGIVALYAQFGSGSTNNGGDVGIGVMGAVFILMGVVPLGVALWSWRIDRSDDEDVEGLGATATGASTRPGQFSSEGLRKLSEMQSAARAAATAPAQSTPASAGGAAAPDQVAAWQRSGSRSPAAPPSPEVQLTRSGSATIKTFKYLGKSDATSTLVELELEVNAGGAPPYTVVHQEMVPLTKTRELSSGSTLRVRVDRDNPADLTISW